MLSTVQCNLCGSVNTGSELDRGLCPFCRHELSTDPGPYVLPPGPEIEDSWVWTAREYGGRTLQLIERIKLGADLVLLTAATELLLAPLLQHLLRTIGWNDHPVCIVPIPASRRGRRHRGFDQSRRLVEGLVGPDRKSARFIAAPILQRHHGFAQKDLDRSDRFVSIAEQLYLQERAPLPNDPLMVLVDDVVTTGASMHAARRLLETLGASRFLGIALAFRT